MVLAVEGSFLRTWNNTALSDGFFTLNVGKSAKKVKKNRDSLSITTTYTQTFSNLTQNLRQDSDTFATHQRKGERERDKQQT